MKPVIIIAIAVVLLIPSTAFAQFFADEARTLIFSGGGNAGMLSSCEISGMVYRIGGSIRSDVLVPVKVEIIDPKNNVVGIFEDSLKGDLNIRIDVDYNIDGTYLIHFYYKGEIYEKEYGWNDGYLPTHDDQIQCLVAKAINAGTYHEVGRLDTSDIYYETIWENNKDELKKILGDELFSHYELFVHIDAIHHAGINTSLAFEELDKLHTFLNDYSYEKNLLKTKESTRYSDPLLPGLWTRNRT